MEGSVIYSPFLINLACMNFLLVSDTDKKFIALEYIKEGLDCAVVLTPQKD
jgi:hypothetical protein